MESMQQVLGADGLDKLPFQLQWWTADDVLAQCELLKGLEPAEAASRFVEAVRERTEREDLSALCTVEGPMKLQVLYRASPVGALGMGGNVWEWTGDDYLPYMVSNQADPSRDQAQLKVIRGGSFMSMSPWEFRSAARSAMPPDARVSDVGVRCAWSGGDP